MCNPLLLGMLVAVSGKGRVELPSLMAIQKWVDDNKANADVYTLRGYRFVTTISVTPIKEQNVLRH